MAKTRAYRRIVPPDQLARRIVRSIQGHAAEGTVRQPEDYTTHPGTLAQVRALLALPAIPVSQRRPHA